LGWASFIGYIVHDRFRNIDSIRSAQCPVFLLHGKQDTLIPLTHSVELFNACPAPAYLHVPPRMDHNEFHIDFDLIEPIKKFLSMVGALHKKGH